MTYTMHSFLRFSLCSSLAMLTLMPSVAQVFQAAKTEHGQPDLRGVWNFSTSAPFQRPDAFGEREFLTAEEIAEQRQRAAASAIASEQRESTISQTLLSTQNARSAGSVNNFWMDRTGLRDNTRTSVLIYPLDGKLPAVQEGVLVQRSDADGNQEIPGARPVRFTHGGIARTGPEDRGLSERCMVFNSGPPLMSGPYNNNLQIFQNADHVVILTEMGFDARIVPLDGRGAIDASITQWSGDSRGYFDGATLVVETRNFSPQIASLGFRDAAYGSGEKRVLTERFIPTGAGAMDYEFTLQDPDTFTDKIVGVIPMTRTDSAIYEYACHAGNYALRNILNGARVEE